MSNSDILINRVGIADHITNCLKANLESMREQFHIPGHIPSCFVDDILPDSLTRTIFEKFPPTGRMIFKNTLREKKFIAVQLNHYDSVIEESIYAFQDSRVVDLVGQITGQTALEPDVNLYAGGISAMPKGNYLKPHFDNSHDKDRARYRVLNLLFYVSPDWREEFGGHLEFWDNGPKVSLVRF